jgi:hypothetical protein
MVPGPDHPSAADGGHQRVAHLRSFRVVELRRYRVQAGTREAFARYFESFFPEAFQQLGSILFGQFLERADPTVFTWMRGFHDMASLRAVKEAFYDGPLWKEHGATMNKRLVDFANALLLQPVGADREVLLLPAVDPVREADGAGGVVVAQIFEVMPGRLDALLHAAEPAFSGYRATGAREAAVLATLDVPNTFPRHPFRSDGPFLVWLGILPDDQLLGRGFEPEAVRCARALSGTGLLRAPPELVVLDPTPRSRLRWLPG